MRKTLLASTLLAPLAAHAQSLQSGTIGGMPYYELPASGGCSAATPCSVVTYLGYQDETSSATASDVQNYFGGSFAAANPHTIVIAPMLTGNQDSSYNWGGYDAVTNAQTAQMVGVVQGVEQNMGYTVNTADSVVTGGSLGGDGTQSALIGYGPKGTVQAGVFDAGLSFDAADYAAAGNATDIAALCGVPLTAVHGTADTNQSVTYDEGFQSAIDGNPVCGNSFNFVPIQGAGHGTWSGPDGYSAGVGSGTPLGWLSSELTSLSSQPQPTTTAAAAPDPVASIQPLIPQNSLSSITSSAAPSVPTAQATAAPAAPAIQLAAAPAAPTAVSAGSSQSCTVPGPAAGAGFNTETFGQQPLTVGTTPNATTSYPQFTNGADLVPFDFYGTSWKSIGETSGNGSVTLNGTGETFGNGLATASQTPAGQTLNGLAFGGGGYYQVTMSGNGPMSFWMNDATTMDTGSSPNNSWIEADIAEFDTTGAYGFTLHNWESPAGSGNVINANEDGASPAGANYTQPNNYGMLWVPATATTQGSVSFYFNGVQVGNTITWNQYVPGQAAPDNPFAVMDADDMVPILGAGPGTTATFSNLQVWQASAASDIGTGAAAAAAVQPCTGGETTTPAVTPIATPGTAAPATTGATAATTLATTAGSPMQPQSSLATITGASDPASATIVPGQGSLTDSNGNVWTITASGSITENGAFTTGGGGTAALSIVNGTVYGQDNGQDGNTANSGGWFTLSGNGQSWAVSSPPPATTAATGKAAPVTATPAKAVSSAPAAAAPGNPAPSAATTVAPAAPLPPVSTAPIALGLAAQFSCSTATPNSAASAGGFSTVNGQILSPSGQPWIAQGVNVPDFDMQTAQSSLLSLLPGTNFIRLNIYNYAAPSTYQSFINWATSQGIVVEIDDHTSFPSNAFTGSQLTAETQFYSAMAAAYINNPYVWYETQNEPQGGDITAENVAVYNAVRATGNNNPVGFQPLGGGNPGFLSSMDASAYTSMSNVYMAGHFYAWIDGYSTDPATVSAALGNEISAAQSLQSADGPMPVIIDEYGDNVNNTAAGGTQVVTAVLASGYGSAAWSFDNPGGGTEDQLTNNEQSLTAFGQQLAAAEPSTGPGCNITAVPALVPTTAIIPAPVATGTAMTPQNSLSSIPAPAGP